MLDQIKTTKTSKKAKKQKKTYYRALATEARDSAKKRDYVYTGYARR